MSSTDDKIDSGSQNKLDIEAFRQHLLNYRCLFNFVMPLNGMHETFGIIIVFILYFLGRRLMIPILNQRINLNWILVSNECSTKNGN